MNAKINPCGVNTTVLSGVRTQGLDQGEASGKSQTKIGSDPVFLYNSDIQFIMDFLH